MVEDLKSHLQIKYNNFLLMKKKKKKRAHEQFAEDFQPAALPAARESDTA